MFGGVRLVSVVQKDPVCPDWWPDAWEILLDLGAEPTENVTPMEFKKNG
jgi:hypothetical protein